VPITRQVEADEGCRDEIIQQADAYSCQHQECGDRPPVRPASETPRWARPSARPPTADRPRPASGRSDPLRAGRYGASPIRVSRPSADPLRPHRLRGSSFLAVRSTYKLATKPVIITYRSRFGRSVRNGTSFHTPRSSGGRSGRSRTRYRRGWSRRRTRRCRCCTRRRQSRRGRIARSSPDLSADLCKRCRKPADRRDRHTARRRSSVPPRRRCRRRRSW